MKTALKIQGRYGAYRVDWVEVGLGGYIQIVVREWKNPRRWWPWWSSGKVLWTSERDPRMRRDWAEKAHPRELLHFYAQTVRSYESWLEAWTTPAPLSKPEPPLPAP